MKLKNQTFAVIAEKKDSISHKWFNQYARSGKNYAWWKENYYIYDKGISEHQEKNKPKNMPIYTESEFEAILKAEQENERYKETMDRVIAPQVLEMAKFKEENPNATEEEIETKRNELVFKYAHKPTISNSGESANIVYADFKTPISGPKNTIFGKEGIAHKHPPFEPKGDGNLTLDKNATAPSPYDAQGYLLNQAKAFAPISEMKDPVKSTESNQVTFTYQTAIDLLAYYTKIDKGIIKIEMP